MKDQYMFSVDLLVNWSDVELWQRMVFISMLVNVTYMLLWVIRIYITRIGNEIKLKEIINKTLVLYVFLYT